MIKLFRMNTGSCGACDAETEAAVYLHKDLVWTASPFEADVLLLTGPLTATSKPGFQAVWSELADTRPLIAVGRCAIDGYPFGKGGLADNPEITVTRKVDGCPPEPGAVAAAIRASLNKTV